MRICGSCCKDKTDQEETVFFSDHSKVLVAGSWPTSLGGVIGASLAAFGIQAFKGSIDAYLKPCLNACFRHIPLQMMPYAEAASPYVAPAILFIAGVGYGAGMQIAIQRCLRKSIRTPSEEGIVLNSLYGKNLKPEQAPKVDESRVNAGKKKEKRYAEKLSARAFSFFDGEEMGVWLTGVPPCYDVVKTSEISQMIGDKLQLLSERQLQELCLTKEFWILADSISPDYLSAQVLKAMALHAVEDAQNDAIYVLNRILSRLKEDDPELEKKLKIIAACGHPGLWEDILFDKAKAVDARDAIKRIYAEEKTERFGQLDVQIERLFAHKVAAIEPLASFLSTLNPPEIQYICSSDLFWSRLDEVLNSLENLDSDVSLETLAVLKALAMWDSRGNLIDLINRILGALDVSVPQLREKLLLIAACGHPELNLRLLESLAGQLGEQSQKTGDVVRKIQSVYRKIYDTSFYAVEMYFSRIPEIMNPRLVNEELLKTFAPLMKKLHPSQTAFLCKNSQFWAVIQNENMRPLLSALTVECLAILARFTLEDANQRVFAVNDILYRLDEKNDADAERKLYALAACGNPYLDSVKLKAKALQLKLHKVRMLMANGVLQAAAEGQVGDIPKQVIESFEKAKKKLADKIAFHASSNPVAFV